MPEGTRVHKCVEAVKKKGGGNPYAICQSSTGQSFRTGKALKNCRTCIRRRDGSVRPPQDV
jgi:hypothetical protein